MTSHSDPHEFHDLEQAALALTARIRQLKEAMRSLAVLGQEVAGLQEVLVSVAPDGRKELGDDRSMPPRPRGMDDPPPGPTNDVSHALTSAMAAAAGMHGGSTNGADRPSENAPEPAIEGLAPPPRTVPNVAVTVSTQGGSVDLVRLYRALQRMPQIEELNLTSYSGGRAVVGLITSAPPRALPIEEALHEAFPEGIVGDWTGDAEFVAVVTTG